MADVGFQTRSGLTPEANFCLFVCLFVTFLFAECSLQTRHLARNVHTHNLLSFSQLH